MQFLCDQDREDFEQEKRINEWLSRALPGRSDLIESQHINRKGNARNTLIKANFSLDQNLRRDEPGAGTFADIVTGFDGRDLENGNPDFHFNEHFNATVWETLTALGLNYEEILCLINLWLHSETLSELLSPISMTDLEWEIL